MTKNKIYFLRHGESEANVKGTFAGQRENSSLTEKGKAQAKDAALDLIKKKIKPQKIYV
jgi:broad specificity phosphatase PhoE